MKRTVPGDLDGERADRVVAVLTGTSRARARRLVEDGNATFGGQTVAPSVRVASGAVVRVWIPDPPPGLVPERVPFEVRYEDEHLAIVDKPAGITVHPGAGQQTGTLAAGLLRRWPKIDGVGEESRWGIVHRLDTGTSGLLVVALTPEAHALLTEAMASRKIRRSYLALAHGSFEVPRGTVDAPVGRDPTKPVRFRVGPAGRPARTHYRRLAAWQSPQVTLLELELETGRTHQIRVHLASIGHPVVGDAVYGNKGAEPPGPRVWLHATRLSFKHPIAGDELTVESPLPDDLAESLAALGMPAVGRVPEM
ncbi:MAG: RluA family pseudouridine synthase [Acidimicrobiia bacterium]